MNLRKCADIIFHHAIKIGPLIANEFEDVLTVC